MKTRLAAFSDTLVEAGWLVILSVVPLVVNILGPGAADLAKSAVLRSVALMMLAAWLVSRIEVASTPARPLTALQRSVRRALAHPVTAAVALLAAVYLLATLLSIQPRFSLWGTYQRAQGAYTFLAYLILFFLVRGCLRESAQMQRVITAVTLSSAPVALYGLLQHFRLDPLLQAIPPFYRQRVSSTLGNPIFLGNYLAIVIPLTLLQLWMAVADSAPGPTRRWTRVALYAVLFALQESALVMTGSRGPFVAHLVGLLFMVLLWAGARGRRRFVALNVGVGVVAVALVAVLNLPRMDTHLKERFGRQARLVRLANLTYRDAIWKSLVSTLRSNPGRLVAGYGPETTAVVVLPYLTPEAARHANARGSHWDRAHNTTFEALVTMGIPGLVAYLLLFGSLFYVGLRTLGLLATTWHRRAFVSLLALGATAGSVIPRAVTGAWQWLGLGMPVGMLAGLALYVAGHAVLRRTHIPDAPLDWSRVLALALLTGVITHFVATQVGIPTTTDLTCFWVYAALLAVLDVGAAAPAREKPGIQHGSRSARRSSRRERREDRTPSWYPLLVAALLATLAFDFLWIPGIPLVGSGSGLIWLFVAAWVVGTWLSLYLNADNLTDRHALAGWARYALISLGGFALFCLMRAGGIFLVGHEIDFHVYMAWVALSLIVLAAMLRADGATIFTSRPWAVGLYGLMVVAVAGVVWITNLRPVQADTYAGSAQVYAAQGRWEESILLYRRAISTEPTNDVYYLRLGEAYAQYAETVDATQRGIWFQEAAKAAHQAWRLNPGQTYHAANLAHVYLLWAQASQTPETRGAALQQAAFLYDEASRVLRYDARLFREWGLVLQLQGDTDGALEKYRQALVLDPTEAETHRLMGYLYQEIGKLDAAEKALREAARLDPLVPEVHTALGEIYLKQDRLQNALAESQQAVKLAPEEYELYLNLALVYRRLGRLKEAIATVETARTYAPADQQPALQRLIDDLRAGR